MKLHTIGYEGQNLVSFGAVLEKYQIRRIVDVREIPLSHKSGFSKTRLREFLQSIDIEYIHAQSLGCPKEIRNDYRAGKDWECYKARYLQFMGTRTEDLLSLLESVSGVTSCLLCFEADHSRCHRSFIAARLAEMSDGKLQVVPIVPIPTGS